LSRREADFVDGQQAIVVKNVAMDHARSPRTTNPILTEKGQVEVRESNEARGTKGIDCNERMTEEGKVPPRDRFATPWRKLLPIDR
jgi:hypothetical protein